MEIALFWLIVWLATKNFVADLPFTLRGKYPPRHQYRMEKLRQRAGGGGRSVPRTGIGRYFSGLVNDSVEQAHARRSAKHQVKRPYKVQRAADRTKARMDRKQARRTGPARSESSDRSAADAEDAETAPDVPDLLAVEQTVDPGSVDSDTRPIPVIAPAGTRRLQSVRQTPEAVNPEPAPPAQTPDPVEQQADPEVGSLTTAISYVEMVDATLRVAETMIHHLALGLDDGKVGGPAKSGLAEAWDKLEASIADMQCARQCLDDRIPTKDLSSKIEGSTGDEGWLTAGAKPTSSPAA